MNKQKWQFELGILELVIDLNMMQESQFYVTTSHMHVGLGKIVVWKRKTKETPILILSFPVLFYLTVICKKKTQIFRANYGFIMGYFLRLLIFCHI